MSQLKRIQGQYGQPARGASVARRSMPVAPQYPLATEAAELRLLDAIELTAAQRGDPYNGVGSRAIAAARTLRR